MSSLPIDFFDDFSWRSFIALNWPAMADLRGQPDTNKKVDADGTRVWETFKADFEIFQPGGVTPSTWTSFDAVTPCADIPAKDSGKTRILGSFAKFGDFNQAGFGVPGSPLVAQNKTYARYEIRVNQEEFQFIFDNKLYLRSSIQNLTKPLSFTNGSMELKAAWRQIQPNELATVRKRYYVTHAKVPDPFNGNKSVEVDLALVGLHIVQKTPLRPQWVWSTFEHVDNVPDGAPDPGISYSFNNPTLPQQIDPMNPPATLSATNLPASNPKPMQVVRIEPLHKNTRATNKKYRDALNGTVWANYQLVMTQWPTDTSNPDSLGNPFPPEPDFDHPGTSLSVSNCTMETYFQNTSCMLCHDFARQRNPKLKVGWTDFVWFVNLRAFPQDSATLIAARAELMKLRQTNNATRGGSRQRLK